MQPVPVTRGPGLSDTAHVEHASPPTARDDRLGSVLDPIADKSLVLTALITLSVVEWGANWSLPVWFSVLVIAREDGVKEVKLFQLGPRLLDRYGRHDVSRVDELAAIAEVTQSLVE